MYLQNKLANWAASVRNEANLPARLVLWNGKQHDLGVFSVPLVTIHLKAASALQYFLRPTLDRLGEAYVKDKIDIKGALNDIVDIGYRLVKNTTPDKRGSGRIRIPGYPWFGHSKSVDKKAIEYHYDVSNEFYRLWLDPNMVYSCAYFENGDEDLATAQIKKIDHILKKIDMQPGQTLLDIGCGWGALVLRAAKEFGARCVGITLSENQFALASERVKEAGLQDRIEIRLQDYRDVAGQFDRITSVGMFEHVGLRNLPGYFGKMRELLKEDGIAMNHGITASDADSRGNAQGGTFIDKYVFPHGELPHIGLALHAMQQGGLEVCDVENLRRHYAHTLQHWTQNFEQASDAVRQHVSEEKFRIWRVYLAGCAYAFAHDNVSIYQVVCRHAGRQADTLPWSRGYMYR